MKALSLQVDYDTNSPPEILQCRRILDFWHKVEFFIPYDLEGQILEHQDKDWAVRPITARQWAAIAPQSHGDLWTTLSIPEGKCHSGFELYLGIFDKSQLSDSVREALQHVPSDVEITEDFERGDLEGLTCFAKIALNEHAEPLMDKVSVSTVPWALGRLQQVGIGGLDFDSFQAGLENLKYELTNFQLERQKTLSERGDVTNSSENFRLPMLRADVENLQEILFSWAGFKPGSDDGVPVAVIRVLAKVVVEDKPKPNDEEDDSDIETENEVDILNSFFAKDIQRILEVLSAHHARSPLVTYLTPISKVKRIDLYTDTGRDLIQTTLHPGKMPRGRWLSESKYQMSLMQQFAINQVFIKSFSEGEIFSVNGPPGTGKTTLLRDIFAENITQRARILAQLKDSSDAFQSGPKPKVEIEGGASWHIALLIPELTGFEMLLASSNNAAVENISRDLPKTSSLGKINKNKPEAIAWRHSDGTPKLTYLQPVAAKYVARNKKGTFDSLSTDENPWALIACALGNKTNRYRFVESVFFENDQKKPPKGYDPHLHQTLWQWRDCYKGPTFAEARLKFLEADEKCKKRQAELVLYVNAIEDIGGLGLDDYVLDEMQKATTAELAWQEKQGLIDAIKAEVEAIKITLADLNQLRSIMKKPSISLFNRLFNPDASRKYRAAKAVYSVEEADNRKMLQSALLRKIQLETSIKSAQEAVEAAKMAFKTASSCLSRRKAQWKSSAALIQVLRAKFTTINTASISAFDLEKEEWQRNGLWSDHEINQCRSELFAAALTLHEAWLSEVLQKGGGFGANLYAVKDLLKGARLRTPENALPIWQSLFMVVPVISSTFASIGNQFRELGSGSLGWLFIDEAGQAVPQAAAGALWRAKRAVVVGDPLQIEPVFTVPAKLIEALAKSSDLCEEDHVLPHKHSAQNLADLANPMGTSITDTVDKEQCREQWIGSPLRVHRRCADPMFKIANAIAYEGKMIHAENPPTETLGLGCSAWVDIAGTVGNKQVVEVQIKLVVEALVMLYITKGELPSIYIISPFKRIASTIKRDLSDVRVWKVFSPENSQLPSKTVLKEWCRGHVGTVHTFQGKQAPVVWFVLGCDNTTEGAVRWAASKPNILNVALTRAEHLVFIIGSVSLWGSCRFFDQATADLLPRISASDFLSRMRLCTTKRNSPTL